MIYYIVAGEEMKKLLKNRFDPIPFNEDMSKGNYSSVPYSDAFIEERSKTHGVTITEYTKNMSKFLSILPKISKNDDIHLYFGNDSVCKANSELLIGFFKDKVGSLIFHLMNEYSGTELSIRKYNNK